MPGKNNRQVSRTCWILAWAVLSHVFLAAAAPSAERVDFDTEIIPLLTRHGCNAGSCHGAAIGRGGFKLSLLGSDAAADHDAIVRHLGGRRVNLADADESLVLRKPAERIEHEGGLVLDEASAAFALLRRWIDEGARRHRDRKLTNLVVTPPHKMLAAKGESALVRVVATFDSDETRDVTAWTVFRAADPEAVSIEESPPDDQHGLRMTVHRRGVHVVIARYLDRVMPIRLTVPMRAEPAEHGDDDRPGAGNPIDDLIYRQLEELNLPVSPQADDWMFIRRVTLDLTGRLPSAAEARRYAQSDAPEKRSALVRRLLDSDAFADYWALKWANQLGIDSKQLQVEGADAYHRWIVQRLRNDAPMNETAHMMLTSTGDGFLHGAVNFIRSGSSPGDLAESASRTFMGVRLQCANCHDHPLDHWKQDDYHGLAAIFARVQRARVVTVLERGDVTHPVTGMPAVRRIPGDRYLDDSVDARVALADWLTSNENPYFARATVNRIWQQLMGRGLVDPVDDIRTTNPPTHPRLLQWLADDFVAHGFRVKRTVELICNSAAYGRSSVTSPENEPDDTFYSRALVRPLEAEVLADAISDITGIPLRAKTGALPRTITLTDNRIDVPSLDVLGRCDREDSCEQRGDSTASLARALHLVNGDLINGRVSAPDGRLHQLLGSEKDNHEVLDEIFLWTLGMPAASESNHWRRQLAQLESDPTERTEFFEDLLWGLMTSRSFATNR